ncbi:MAG: hypothetical protein LLG01_13890 [Planctomycetaceae bacterium]|nr:hypothetical protein [Planctomycetaceae bacterium]
MRTTIRRIACVAILAWAAAATAASPPPATPLKVQWAYSSDAGKTFTDQPPAADKAPVYGRATFEIDDPAAVGMLWFATKVADGVITPVNNYVVGGRYISNPLILEEAVFTVNGKAAPPEIPGSNTLYLRWGVDPQLLKKGANELLFRGRCLLRGVKTAEFQLTVSPPTALALRSGPALGPIGEDYFTLACRTWIPCPLAVKVKPLEPAGAEQVHSFPRGTLHQVRVSLPKGTRKFRYSVLTGPAAGAKESAAYDVRVPDPAKGLKFVVMGQTAANTGPAGLSAAAKKILELDPDFIIHTGSLVIYAYWDAVWDELFFSPLADLLARKPMCVVPAYKDWYSQQFSWMFYHPTADGAWAPWSWACGPVRFVGVDGLSAAAQGPRFAEWFEGALKDAKEDFLFEVTSYPAYTTLPFGRGQPGVEYDKTVLQPLLAKYRATASLGCAGKFEYIPPPVPASVPSIITGGVGSPMSPGWTKYNFCVFTIKDGKCSYQALAYETGEVLDSRTFKPRPRNP